MLERYRVNKEIGTGGFSKVYEVYDTHLDKRYAMKIVSGAEEDGLNNNTGAPGGNTDSEGKTTSGEIRMLRELSHEGLPRLHDVFESQGRLYIIMELVEGTTLYEYVKEKGRLSNQEALDLGRKICEILFYLHSRSIPVLYGDLKPQNIMIQAGKIRLVDLGGAFFQHEARNCVYGTLGYAAPELQKGKLYPGSDIYSFGKVMIFMLTGIEGVLYSQNVEKKELTQLGICGILKNTILKCLQQEPEQRYYSAVELKEALDLIKEGKRKIPGSGCRLAGNIVGLCAFLEMLFVFLVGRNIGFEERNKLLFISLCLVILSVFLKIRGEDLYRTAILEYECRILFTQKENA